MFDRRGRCKLKRVLFKPWKEVNHQSINIYNPGGCRVSCEVFRPPTVTRGPPANEPGPGVTQQDRQCQKRLLLLADGGTLAVSHPQWGDLSSGRKGSSAANAPRWDTVMNTTISRLLHLYCGGPCIFFYAGGWNDLSVTINFLVQLSYWWCLQKALRFALPSFSEGIRHQTLTLLLQFKTCSRHIAISVQTYAQILLCSILPFLLSLFADRDLPLIH